MLFKNVQATIQYFQKLIYTDTQRQKTLEK